MPSVRLDYTNTATKLAVIGDPVEHSLSPLIHNTLLQHLGLPYIYLALRIPSGAAARWIEAARLLDFAGFNVTMPHKTVLAELADVLSPDAVRCRAVNTAVLRNGRLYGHNTDGEGFLRSLRDAELDPGGRTIAILGAGGAGRAAALKLGHTGTCRVTVCCRTPEKAAGLRRTDERIHICSLCPDELYPELEKSDLLINGTPLGMSGVAENFVDFGFLDALRPGAAVCDLIYSPLQTELLRRASAQGRPVLNGLGMLIHQAILALELFTETSVDAAAARMRVEEALCGILC